jgi:hypothetical protein
VSGQLHADGAYGTGGWLGPRASLDDVENRKFLTLPAIELRSLGRPARSQSLHLLSYPGCPNREWETCFSLNHNVFQFEPQRVCVQCSANKCSVFSVQCSVFSVV